MPACPFCERIAQRAGGLEEHEREVSFPDAYPVSRGHTLVVPLAHVSSFFELSEDDQASAWRRVIAVRRELERTLGPDGFNIGLNDGPVAGQTVEHAHIHVIPRYARDVEDPRGGVRWVIPERARYWD